LRVGQERVIIAADVARKADGRFPAALVNFQHDVGRAQQVPGRDERHLHALLDAEFLVVRNGHHAVHGFVHLAVEVQVVGVNFDAFLLFLPPSATTRGGQFGLVRLEAFGVEVRHVLEQQLGQRQRGGRAENLSFVAFADQVGQVARVVDVGVGKQHHVDLRGLEREHAVGSDICSFFGSRLRSMSMPQSISIL
jgi:hypothetical protein